MGQDYLEVTWIPERFRIFTAHKSSGEEMAGKSKKSKAYSLHPAKTIKPEEKTKARRKMHLDMKEKLWRKG